MNALLSHEMRSPVATISAAVQSLEMVLEGSDEQIDSRLQRIGRAIARISELMDQLLVQESAYDEAVAPRHEVVDLARLAADVVASIQHDVAHRLRLEAPAPSPAWCDGPLTGVVLRNLIHNAVKYSPADQPITIQVGTLTAPGERTAWIAVADRGPGIEKEDQTRIFDPHFRRAAHRETKGLGLGLYLVRKICERQGGTLTVESEPGKGARFTIALPVSKVR
jgi:signal transduction histidine kinase